MKREIKFRIWETDLKRMNYKGGITVSNNEITDFLGEPMQFTGLLDRHGKEIYEGDILRTLHFQTESTINYMFHKVVYDEVRGTFNAINVMNKDEELTTNGNCFLYVALKDKTCELIGNLFETPELLKA